MKSLSIVSEENSSVLWNIYDIPGKTAIACVTWSTYALLFLRLSSSVITSLSKRLSTWAIVIAGGLLSNVWDFWQCLDAGVVTDMERPGTCKRTYFCFLSFSFSKRGVVPHSQHIHPPLKVIGKQSIVNSLNHYSQTFPVSGPLCTLTIHREPQRAFPYTYRL